MTTPLQLLELAAELANDSRESARRTAASRAYYAAFWHLGTIAADRFGHLDASGTEVHAELGRVVELWDEELAKRLRNLRVARNSADYEPETSFTPALAARSILVGEEILAVT